MPLLSNQEAVKLDGLIEEYLETRPLLLTQVIDDYLASLNKLERRLFKTIYIELKERVKDNDELKEIYKHKQQLFAVLQSKGLIKETKIKKVYDIQEEIQLNKFKELSDTIEMIKEKIYLLENLEESNVQVKDYSKVKIKSSYSNSPRILNKLDEILECKKWLEDCKKQREAEKEKLLAYINSIEDTEVRLIIEMRYYLSYSYSRIAEVMGLSVATVRKKHNEGVEGNGRK